MAHRILGATIIWACAAVRMQAQINTASLDALAAKATESVNITMDPATLQMAAKFLSQPGQAETKQLLSGLKAITVRSFEFDKEGQYRVEDLAPIRTQLRAPDWSKVIEISEKTEKVEIYSRTQNGQVSGLAVLSAEPKELTVVYIDGNIDLAGLAGLTGNLGIPRLPVPGARKAPAPPVPPLPPPSPKKGN